MTGSSRPPPALDPATRFARTADPGRRGRYHERVDAATKNDSRPECHSANAGRVGQVALSGYLISQGALGAWQGGKDLKQGRYFAAFGNILLGFLAAFDGVRIGRAEFKTYGKGKAFEQLAAEQAEAVMTNVRQQVKVRPLKPNGHPYRAESTDVDIIGNSKDTGDIVLWEAKSTPTAPMTKGQLFSHPVIKSRGGQVFGDSGLPFFPAGTPVPPTTVRIYRPSDVPLWGFWMDHPAILAMGLNNSVNGLSDPQDDDWSGYGNKDGGYLLHVLSRGALPNLP